MRRNKFESGETSKANRAVDVMQWEARYWLNTFSLCVLEAPPCHEIPVYLYIQFTSRLISLTVTNYCLTLPHVRYTCFSASFFVTVNFYDLMVCGKPEINKHRTSNKITTLLNYLSELVCVVG
jgi:hypothetical protein